MRARSLWPAHRKTDPSTATKYSVRSSPRVALSIRSIRQPLKWKANPRSPRLLIYPLSQSPYRSSLRLTLHARLSNKQSPRASRIFGCNPEQKIPKEARPLGMLDSTSSTMEVVYLSVFPSNDHRSRGPSHEVPTRTEPNRKHRRSEC